MTTAQRWEALVGKDLAGTMETQAFEDAPPPPTDQAAEQKCGDTASAVGPALAAAASQSAEGADIPDPDEGEVPAQETRPADTPKPAEETPDLTGSAASERGDSIWMSPARPQRRPLLDSGGGVKDDAAEVRAADLDTQKAKPRRASSATLDRRTRMEAAHLQGTRRALSAARARIADAEAEFDRAEGEESAAAAATAGAQPSAPAQADAEAALRAALGWHPAPADPGGLDEAMRALGQALLQGASAGPPPQRSHRGRERDEHEGAARGQTGAREGMRGPKRHLR